MATLKFNFLCFLFIIICYSAHKQREYKNLTKDTLKPRQTGKSTNSPRRYKWSTFFAPFFNMIGCRSCQCWCVGCQNRWWSTEEDSSLEFKTSKVWTNNETLNVSPHPAGRVLVSFICLILAHSSLLSMCCLLLACCWGTVSYPGIIAVFLLHRARLYPLVYRLRAVSFFFVRRAKCARHACDWRRVAGEFLASRGFAAGCSRKRALGLPLQKERLHVVWSVYQQTVSGTGKN